MYFISEARHARKTRRADAALARSHPLTLSTFTAILTVVLDTQPRQRPGGRSRRAGRGTAS
jgi:hypothetical protein